jgi:hypothetical protein
MLTDQIKMMKDSNEENLITPPEVSGRFKGEKRQIRTNLIAFFFYSKIT